MSVGPGTATYRLEFLGKAARRLGLGEEFDSSHGPEVDFIEEVERLRAIIAKLLRTADDVPGVPGMKLYGRVAYSNSAVMDNSRSPATAAREVCTSLGGIMQTPFYSTREAADAARGGDA